MAYDLEEQEQLAQLKAFWAQWGNALTWLLTLVLAAYAGWQYWEFNKRNQALEASRLYEEVQKAAEAKDSAKILRATADMESKFAGTTYAAMSALLAAKVSYEANDAKSAKAQLQWAAENGKDEELQVVAKLRLAGLLLDEKNYDAALKIVDGSFPPQFASVVQDRKGDILVAQNKLAEARAAYQSALDKGGKEDQARQIIQLKLDALGGGKAA
jgi:predicted negative regulator of RcsB-dependent stress response